MGRIWIKDFEEGRSYEQVLLVDACSVRQTAKGDDYLSLTLKDKTASVSAKMWKASTPIPEGTYIRAIATAETYNGALQLNVRSLSFVGEDLVDFADFLPVAPEDNDAMWDQLNKILGRYSDDPMVAWTLKMLSGVSDDFRSAPAAKHYHQAYIGGLLEHSRNLARLAAGMTALYPGLDFPLLVCAAPLHDLGKVWELEYSRKIGTTRDGELLGHIVLGLQYLMPRFEHFNERNAQRLNHLAHIIASHHGKLEWGSPVVPATPEAILFHQLDMVDSRMGTLAGVADEALDDRGMTPYQKGFDARLWLGRPVP